VLRYAEYDGGYAAGLSHKEREREMYVGKGKRLEWKYAVRLRDWTKCVANLSVSRRCLQVYIY
jgi:hypothetical protein